MLRETAGARPYRTEARPGLPARCPFSRHPLQVRPGRLESAAILLARSRWEDAQAALDRLQPDLPRERTSLDTGLPALNLAKGRKEFQRAFTAGQTLLALAGGDPRQFKILSSQSRQDCNGGKPPRQKISLLTHA